MPDDSGPSIEEIRAMGALASTASDQSLPQAIRDGAAQDLGAAADQLSDD